MKLPRNLGGRDLAKALRVGTLAAILADVADHFQMSREEISAHLFG